MEVNIRAGDPLTVDLKLETTGLLGPEIYRQVQGEDKLDDGNDEHEPADVAVTIGNGHQDQSAEQRHKGHEGEDEGVEVGHATSPPARPCRPEPRRRRPSATRRRSADCRTACGGELHRLHW